MNIRNKLTFVIIAIILLLSLFVRVYRLDSVPPSLMWDEVSVGYNAWTIAHYLKDEWGNTLPLAFKSFEEYKMPVHIYITSMFTAILGLNEISTRLPSALFGVGNIALLFYLVRLIYKNNLVALLAGFMLALSPFNIHFSRFNHEANFALFFLMLGLIFFMKGVEKGRWIIAAAFISFIVSAASYNAAKIVAPTLVFILLFLYANNILRRWKAFIFPLTLFVICLSVIFIHPGLSGKNRASQVPMVSLEQGIKNYTQYFSWNYLFEKGDRNPRLSMQSGGVFYPIEAAFLLVGLVSLLLSRQRFSYFILSWAFLAPIPGSLFGGTGEIPHSGRAMFMMGSWTLVSACGFFRLISILKNKKLQLAILTIGVILVSYFATLYLNGYFNNFSNRYAIDWQYGMKQIAVHLKKNPEYENVFITDTRSQPYIFLLYYLNTPLSDFRETVEYNTKEDRSSNLVARYGRYNFGNWNKIESQPLPSTLYILTPSEYDGLRHRALFQVKEKISYPNGTDAFYLVSLY